MRQCECGLEYSDCLDYSHREVVMADVKGAVTAADIEAFKVEKAAEFSFIASLDVAVRELRTKVSPRNPVLASMTRFLKGRIG